MEPFSNGAFGDHEARCDVAVDDAGRLISCSVPRVAETLPITTTVFALISALAGRLPDGELVVGQLHAFDALDHQVFVARQISPCQIDRCCHFPLARLRSSCRLRRRTRGGGRGAAAAPRAFSHAFFQQAHRPPRRASHISVGRLGDRNIPVAQDRPCARSSPVTDRW
jgi:hypothetical protein